METSVAMPLAVQLFAIKIAAAKKDKNKQLELKKL